MPKYINNTTAPVRKAIFCKKCGSTEFNRIVEEEPSFVRVFMVDGYIDDEVIREGDKQFTYECANCSTIFDGDEDEK